MKKCDNCYYYDKPDCLPKGYPFCENRSKWKPKDWDVNKGLNIGEDIIRNDVINKIIWLILTNLN